MATIVSNLTTLHDAETTTGAVGNKPVLEPEIKKQGNNSVGFTVTQNPTSGLSFSAVDLTGQHARLWYTSITFPNMDTEANGGLRFYAVGGGNKAYWNIAGSDTYFGGWLNIVVDMDSTPDSGTFDKTSVTEIGVEIITVSNPKNLTNTWIDFARYGNGLTAYGATAFGMEEIYQADLANGYGIVDKTDGVYFLSGEVELGDSAGVNACNYEDDGETLVFSNKNVSSTLYKIIGVGNATGDTDITFNNCAIKSAGPIFDIDMDDPTIESFTLNGCVVQGADQILLDSVCTITGTTFNACGEITPEAATVEDCTVSNSTATNAYIYPALVADDNSARITFIGNTNAVEVSSDVDHTFDGHKFPIGSNTFDVNNTSGQTVIIYATNGSTASTSTGSTVDIQNSVAVTLTGVIEGTEISIQRAGTTTVESYIASSAANGEFTYTFNSPPSGFTNVDIFLVKPGYEWEAILNYPLPSVSTELPIVQQVDRNYIS